VEEPVEQEEAHEALTSREGSASLPANAFVPAREQRGTEVGDDGSAAGLWAMLVTLPAVLLGAAYRRRRRGSTSQGT
jgi:hypothetical protein